MKSKIFKTIIKILVVIAIICVVFFLGRQAGLSAEISSTKTTTTNESVEKRTIKKELSSSGEILSNLTEKLVPSITKYFKGMCVEEDDTVKSGENILQYSDGTYMTADYDMVITSISVPETGTKATSSNYIEVQSLESLIMSISVSENQINYLEVGQEVTITPTVNEDNKTYAGTVSKIDSVGTYQSSGTTYAVNISFENDGNLKIGMSASCNIILDEVTDVLAVPINAVLTSNSQKYVVIVNTDGTTLNQNVEIGMSDDDYVEITSGIEEGQTVQIVTTTTQSTTKSSSSSSLNQNFGGMSGGTMGSGTQEGGFDKSMMRQNGSGMPSTPGN